MTVVTHMPRVRALIQTYQDLHGSSLNHISERMGMAPGALSGWWGVARPKNELSVAHQLYMLARAIQTPYRDVLDAALADFDYLPESAAAAAAPPARMNRKGAAPSRLQKQLADEQMTAPQEEGPEFGA